VSGAHQVVIFRNFPQLCGANPTYPTRRVLGAILAG
jgi:hypothetical protein